MADDEEPLPTLQANKVDILVATAKGVLSAVPIVGGFLQELVETTIPNQQIDRLADFSNKLAKKFERAEYSIEALQQRKEEAAPVIEEAIRQAARAASELRRDILASLVAENVRDIDRSGLRADHMLRLLDQMSDLEVQYLAYKGKGWGFDFRITEMENPAQKKVEFALRDGIEARLLGLGLLTQETLRDEPRRDSWKPTFPDEIRTRVYVSEAGEQFLQFLNDEILQRSVQRTA